jgi:hypothetical protein
MVLSPFHLIPDPTFILSLEADYSIDKTHGFMEKS